MKAGIVSIGTELLVGEVVDTNAPYLASQLLLVGLEVKSIVAVPDRLEDLTEAFDQAWRRFGGRCKGTEKGMSPISGCWTDLSRKGDRWQAQPALRLSQSFDEAANPSPAEVSPALTASRFAVNLLAMYARDLVLPDRSFCLFGPRPMYPLSKIAAVTGSVDPFVLRQFVGGPEWGWKVAYSDRMVSMYTGFWIAAVVFTAFRRRIRPLPIWGFLLFCLPMVLDGGTHLLLKGDPSRLTPEIT